MAWRRTVTLLLPANRLATMDRAVDGKPKLLMTTTTLPRWQWDTEPRFILDLAIAMRGTLDVTILAPRSPGAAARETIGGVAIERYRYAPLEAWETLAAPGAILPNIRTFPLLALLVPSLFVCQIVALAKLLRRERFNVVHCHWLIPQGLAFAALSVLRVCPPSLLTCHGGDAFTLNRWPLRWLKAWAVRRMGAVTAVSAEIVEYLEDLLGPGAIINPQHIPMGVDLDRFRPAGIEATPRPDPDAGGAAPKILFVGRIAEKKGLQVLIEALRKPDLTAIGATLRVVGDGPMRARIETGASDLIAAGRLDFAGALAHEALTREFQAADVFCAPFVVAADGDREGTPTVLMEAASSGLPIIASDIGGCRDLIVPGRSGWLVAPGNPHLLAETLAEALGAPEIASECAREAREDVKRFGWPVIGRRYAEALNAIAISRES